MDRQYWLRPDEKARSILSPAGEFLFISGSSDIINEQEFDNVRIIVMASEKQSMLQLPGVLTARVCKVGHFIERKATLWIENQWVQTGQQLTNPFGPCGLIVQITNKLHPCTSLW